MCLITRKPSFIAEEDIVCYKILRYSPETDTYISPYRKFKYEIGKLYKSIIVSKNECFWDDLDLNPKNFINLKNKYGTDILITNGLHAYLNKSPLIVTDYTVRLAKAIIPKGSLCYTNNKEIVSNQMIITEILT